MVLHRTAGKTTEVLNHLQRDCLRTVPGETDAVLHQVQLDLFEVGAYLASPGTSRFPGVEPDRITELENAIDAMEQELEPAPQLHPPRRLRPRRPVARGLHGLPPRRTAGGGPAARLLRHPLHIAYLNRLSDFCSWRPGSPTAGRGWMTCPGSGRQRHGGGFRPLRNWVPTLRNWVRMPRNCLPTLRNCLRTPRNCLPTLSSRVPKARSSLR